MDVLDSERDNSSAHLNRHGVRGFKSQLVLKKDDCSKLTRVVFDVKSVGLALNDGMASTDTNVINSHL